MRRVHLRRRCAQNTVILIAFGLRWLIVMWAQFNFPCTQDRLPRLQLLWLWQWAQELGAWAQRRHAYMEQWEQAWPRVGARPRRSLGSSGAQVND